MRPWQFSKPKTPGFGLNKSFYLSILSSKSVLPTLLEIIEPKATNGAVEGFGAPLSKTATKEALAQPIIRGAYALATKDRKTVLRMLVLSKEEAGFDPDPFLSSELAKTLPDELLLRVKATWTLLQLTIESHDAAVYPATDFILSISQKLAELSDGVIADPVSKRYLLPDQVFQPERADPKIDAREHVSVNMRQKPDGIHCYTLGMQKFNLPELELHSLLPEDRDLAATFVLAICQSALLGDLVKNGDKYGASTSLFEVREGGFDTALWNTTQVFELLPPTSQTASEALHAYFAEVAP